MDRAYSQWTVKALDGPRRRIRGIASTPRPDRVGDIVEPAGVTFTNPLPLLLFHNRERPVGRVTFSPPTAAGIAFEAELPVIFEPGPLKDEVDKAWAAIQAGLIAWVSIGFRAIGQAIEQLATGGRRFLKTEICELSLVTVPSNVDATLAVVKAYDVSRRTLAPAKRTETPMAPAPYTMAEYQRAQYFLATNPLELKGRDLGLLASLGELDHARQAIVYARARADEQRRVDALEQGRAERIARLERRNAEYDRQRVRAMETALGVSLSPRRRDY